MNQFLSDQKTFAGLDETGYSRQIMRAALDLRSRKHAVEVGLLGTVRQAPTVNTVNIVNDANV